MATIDYPTQTIIEGYLQSVYSSLRPECLTPSISTIGYNAEYHNQPEKYGTLDVVVNKLTGIDIPILLQGTNTSKGTIAIVAQDPLRSESDKNLPKDNDGKIIVGTPFAYHYKRDVYPKTKVYRRIVDKLLEDGYNVYITDAHKIYPKISKGKQSEVSLIDEELKEVGKNCRLYCVVTYGDDALDFIDHEQFGTIHVPVLHPSTNNVSNWDSWIFEQAFWEVMNNANEQGFWSRYACERGRRTKIYGEYEDAKKSIEDIIVESTVDKILNFIKKKIQRDE